MLLCVSHSTSRMTMTSRKLIYEGKAKKLFEGPEPGTVIQHFKDDATAFNGEKEDIISGKGVLNNRISEYLMTRLNEIGVPNHLIRSMNMREQLVKAVQIVPVEVIIRNYAAGSFCKRFGVEEGKALGQPLMEFCLKNDKLGDPFISEDHIFAFQWASPMEMDDIRLLSMRINDYLTGIFTGVGLQLVDLKLEFGRYFEGNQERIILADEISPDNCRLWDMKTGEKMDKDRFRFDLGGVEEAYQEVAKRLGVLPRDEILEEALKPAKKSTAKKASAKKAPAKKASAAAKRTKTTKTT